MKTSITIILSLLMYANTNAQNISGNWSGKIKLSSEKTLEFNFNISKKGDNYITIIDIPTNRVTGLKPKATIFSHDTLFIDGSNLGITYKGVFEANSQKFVGNISERGNTIPLTLKKTKIKSKEIAKRPQEPTKPYPYYEEEVSFRNNSADITLAGTFTKPNTKEKHPVVVLITGSGPQDRDQTFVGHKTFLVLADYLTRNGIAVLRYDDRGTNESTGDFSSATTEDFAYDVVAAINYLKTRNDIDTKNIGLIGHSEGGIIAPLAANKAKDDVAFIVSLAGTGIIGSELVYNQVTSMRAFTVPDEEAFNLLMKKAIDIASSSKDLLQVKSELKEHYNSKVAPILKPMLGSEEKTQQVISGLVEVRTTPWMRYFYNYNPADEYAKIKIPVLSLNGSKDVQVPAELHQNGVKRALEKAQNKKFKIIKLEGLNHLFQEADTGKMNEYSTIDQTFSPKALEIIANWILNLN